MSFMVVYILVSMPASWAIDKLGIKKGVGFGVILTGIFGFTRGYFGDHYPLVLASMIGIAVAQPFILNSITAFCAKWFPLGERATAGGLAVMAQFVGIVVGFAVTPFLTMRFQIPGMLNAYGFITIICVVLFFIFVKSAPPTPPAESDTERTLVFDGMKHILKQRDMLILITIFFIGLGIFNAVSTCMEQIISPRGFTMGQAGALGAVIMIGGILGCLIIPVLSDKFRKRRPFIILCVIICAPGLAGITFATSFGLLLASGFLFGLFFLSVAPVIFQYSAEVSYPAPEATSQGLLILSGQISGILFILAMDALKTASGALTPFLLVMIGLMLVNIILSFVLKESAMIRSGTD